MTYKITIKYYSGNKSKTTTIYTHSLADTLDSFIQRKQIKSVTFKKQYK